MEQLLMCRICLVEDVKMYSLISANLQELYERLVDMPFMTKTKKPVQVCYLCHARLQNCQRLQATCYKSEEFLNKVMANNELKQVESQDLNTLKTVHPLIRLSCVPSTRKDPDDYKINENNDFKFDPSEVTSDAQVKEEFFEDDLFINEAVDIKLEAVKDEDIYSEDGYMSDNSPTMQDTQLEHDNQLKPVKIVLERIDLDQFEIGSSAAKKLKIDLLNGNTESTISIDISESEVTVPQNKNIENKIQSIERAVTVKNKNIMKQISFIDKYKKKKIMDTSSDDVHSKIKQYKCKECGQSFSQKSNLVTHTQIHIAEKPLKYNVCENNVMHKHNLISHTQHMGENLYKCDVCEKSFSQKTRLARHIRIHTGERPFRCTTCNHNFTRRIHLITHTRIHTGETSYKCNVCGKSFNQKSNLVTHTRIHTGERSYICNVCGKSFTQKHNLITHTRIHTGERSYICNVCGKSFTQRSNLITHIRIHTGERSCGCNVCGKSFIQKSSLVKHLRVHTGERPYNCNICEQSFKQTQNLVSHKRIHTYTGERSYTCNVCGKSFTRKSSLVNHSRIHR